MSLYLGLDAGGTKTTCALAGDPGVLYRGEAGSIKPSRVAASEAAKVLAALLKGASTQSGVRLDQITATCIGIAGLRFPGAREWIGSLLATLVSGPIEVCGDEEIALDAAFHGDPGVLVVAGTGSNIVARKPDGQTFNVGGWGPGIGDEGSGYWIGRRATNEACRAYDRGEPTQLLERIMREWCAASLSEMVATANEKPGPDFSRLARLTVEAASEGDAAGARVLTEAGHLLAEDAIVAYRRAFPAEQSTETGGIAFTGGILHHATLVRNTMIAALRQALPGVLILEEAVDAVEGALWRARRVVSRRHE